VLCAGEEGWSGYDGGAQSDDVGREEGARKGARKFWLGLRGRSGVEVPIPAAALVR
jgi:hypothetical protein